MTVADVVTCGAGDGGGDVVVGSWIVKRSSVSTFFVVESLSNRAISFILCFPTLTSLNTYPETPTGQNSLLQHIYQFTYMIQKYLYQVCTETLLVGLN